MASIPQFLRDKVLFVTGATGFVAKGLVEKVLHCAPEVQRIYLMIRPRVLSTGEAVSAETRLEREVFQSSAFARLRRDLGERFNEAMCQKVVAVSGDLTRPQLGIDPEVYARLTREVDVVINIAATVMFDERLDFALEQNTLGPERVVGFAKACRDAILVHVSTAYVSGRQTGSIPERMLPTDRSIAQLTGDKEALPYDLSAEIASIQTFGQQVKEASCSPERQEKFRRKLARQNRGKRMTEHRMAHQLDALTKRWVAQRMVKEGLRRARRLGWHDSYTLTKAMGEQMVARTRGDLPTAIVRPSIIESSLCDPEPGWLDGLKVADPLIAHYGKGRLLDFPADPKIVLDVIPVDVVTNVILAALPKVRQQKEIQVYHVATGSENPVLLGEMFDLVYEYFSQNPMRDKAGKPIAVHRWNFPTQERFERRYRLKYQLPVSTLMWLMDRVPLIPWSSDLRRKISMLEATLARVMALSEIYSSYTHLDCRFETGNTRRLFESLSPEDREAFNFDVSRIQWREYIQEIHIPGLKRHVLKTAEDAQASPARPDSDSSKGEAA